MTITLELGWDARPISEQFPQIDPKVAEHLERDSKDLIRLKIRGLITRAEHKKAVQRFAKNVLAALPKGEDV